MGFITRRSPLVPLRDLIIGIVIILINTSFTELKGIKIRPVRIELAFRSKEVR